MLAGTKLRFRAIQQKYQTLVPTKKLVTLRYTCTLDSIYRTFVAKIVHVWVEEFVFIMRCFVSCFYFVCVYWFSPMTGILLVQILCLDRIVVSHNFTASVNPINTSLIINFTYNVHWRWFVLMKILSRQNLQNSPVI